MKTGEMLASHPRKSSINTNALTACIAACIECADTCNICADACLGEEKVEMLVRCIGGNLNCADICQVTARMISRQTQADNQLMKQYLQLCATVCHKCFEECQNHAEMHEHCRICAQSCQNCEQACSQLNSSL